MKEGWANVYKHEWGYGLGKKPQSLNLVSIREIILPR